MRRWKVSLLHWIAEWASDLEDLSADSCQRNARPAAGAEPLLDELAELWERRAEEPTKTGSRQTEPRGRWKVHGPGS